MIKNVPLFFSVPVAPSARRSYFPLLSSFSGRIFRPLPAPVVSDSEMIPLISFQTAIFSICNLFNLRSFQSSIFLPPRLFGLFRPALLSYSLPWGRSVCLSKISVFFSPSLFPPFLFFFCTVLCRSAFAPAASSDAGFRQRFPACALRRANGAMQAVYL